MNGHLMQAASFLRYAIKHLNHTDIEIAQTNEVEISNELRELRQRVFDLRGKIIEKVKTQYKEAV